MSRKDTVSQIEQALMRITHNMGRRNLGRGMERKLEKLVNFSLVPVVEALDENRGNTSSITVGLIAKHVGIDPSRASRTVGRAIKEGYVVRVASQEDGRRACLALTKKGEKFLLAVKDLRLRYFHTHLKGWSENDCEEFARLLEQFARSSGHRQSDAEAEKNSAQSASTRGGNDALSHLQRVGRSLQARKKRARVHRG